MQSNNHSKSVKTAVSVFVPVFALALGVALAFSPRTAEAQGASGVAAAAQEAGVIFSDERIRQMAERKIRLEEMQQRIEEVAVLQQLETVDPAAARQFKAQIQGGADTGDGFFEAYDKAQIDRGVVLPTLLGVSGSGDDLIAEVSYDEAISFVRVGQQLGNDLRVEDISARSLVVDLRGRKFRISLSGGG